jgi:hypothetical protein
MFNFMSRIKSKEGTQGSARQGRVANGSKMKEKKEKIREWSSSAHPHAQSRASHQLQAHNHSLKSQF